jgi:DNA repair photolyase
MEPSRAGRSPRAALPVSIPHTCEHTFLSRKRQPYKPERETTLADNSAIEWTEATWNPVTGCEEVSPGCAHCYAETFAERWRGIPEHPYEQGFALKLWPQRLEQPLKWSRPRTIFVNSMSDLFYERIPEPGKALA